ncbi:MAG: hypothetical protein RR835_02365 [Peptostreptococcaceae bacterium]
MKKIAVMIILTIITLSTITSYAIGEGNISGGGGSDAGSGTSQNKWRDGDDGVRVSIVDNATKQVIRTPVDFTNKERYDIKYHFGKVSKLQYKRGANLVLHKGNYNYFVTSIKMPTIVSDEGNNIQEIKRYFTSEWVVKGISEKLSIPYEDLISGKYKFLLEPIMYVTFKGQRFAMTAHETAMYNEKINNGVRRKLRSISHQSLPFSMYLEVSDLGFPQYKGSTNISVRDPLMKEQLGLGIIRFNGALPDSQVIPPPPPPPPKPPEPPKPPKPNINVDTGNYDYRTDTDVITSFKINSTTEIGKDNAISATFHILGRDYTVNDIVMPINSSQLVWVKWHTPKTPQDINIGVSITNSNISSANIKVKVNDLKEITPPDPKPRDKEDNFRLSGTPNNGNNTYAEWSKWSCNWKPNKQYVVYGYDQNGKELGITMDKGYWEFSKTKYSANLNANMDLVPGLRTPTWKQNKNEYEMKSGYGVNTNVNTDVTYNCSSNDVTSAQNAITTFSEFKYNKYNRILEKTNNNGFKSKFEFKQNKYSTYNDRTHFTPIWYPDQLNYIVNAEVIDVWTPTGMLRANLNDRIYIDGNLHQDRHIAIMK